MAHLIGAAPKPRLRPVLVVIFYEGRRFVGETAYYVDGIHTGWRGWRYA